MSKQPAKCIMENLVMRVLILARRFCPPWHDGVASYTKGLANALSEISSRVDQPPVDILSLLVRESDRQVQSGEFQKYLAEKNIRLMFTEDSGKGYLSIRRVLRWLKGHRNYDAVHIACTGFDPFPVSLVFGPPSSKRKTRLLKYLYLMPVHHHWPLERYYYRLLQNLDLCPQVTYAYSCERLEKLYATGSNVVVPPAIDTDFFRPRTVSRDLVVQILKDSPVEIGDLDQVLNQEKLVLYMGPVRRDRFPFDYILETFLSERRQFQETGLLVIGRGFEKKEFLMEISHKVRTHGLGGNIFVTLKSLSEEEKALLYGVSDAFLYPFLSPRLRFSVVVPPVALLEAMASGTPVITGGPPPIHGMIRDKENGFLVDEITAEGLVEALTVALDDSTKSVSGMARETVKAGFSIETVAAELQTYFGRESGLQL